MKDRKTVLIRAIILCGITTLLLGGFLIYQSRQQTGRTPRSSGTKEFMEEGIVTWQGDRYRRIPAVTTLLLAGIDRTGEITGISSARYRSGGQADFLMLIAIDHTNKQVHRLQIDRDAMTDVTVLSVYGQETGTRLMQVCLSHSYGATKDDNAHYTVRAVKNLLNNQDIHNWYMVDYTAVSTLADMLGGIRVTVPQDMTSVDPAWTTGAEIVLQGEMTERFVRERKTIGEGTNEERMKRQLVFMDSALNQTIQAISEDSEFGAQLLQALRSKSVSNLSEKELLDILSVSEKYEMLPVEYLEGEYVIGDSGYMEFYPDENSSQDWIIRNLYTKVQ
ncbi:MAG: LCP family protein [Anaerolineaceae bacterium]|nr:LCP family protein [Anaerolineaceae bacterium]